MKIFSFVSESYRKFFGFRLLRSVAHFIYNVKHKAARKLWKFFHKPVKIFESIFIPFLTDRVGFVKYFLQEAARKRFQKKKKKKKKKNSSPFIISYLIGLVKHFSQKTFFIFREIFVDFRA